MTPLIEASELAQLVTATVTQGTSAEARPLLLDVRWTLGGPDGHGEFQMGHIPGAIFTNLETELAGPAIPSEGRHPLPSIETLRAAAAGWGLAEDRPVVVYDDNGGMSAARAWWLLRHAGHGAVRVLNGGLGAWRRAGGAIETGDGPAVAPSATDTNTDTDTSYLHYGGCAILDADSAAALAHSTDAVLLDARAGERYRGEVEPVDPRAGHIPGAVSAPTAGNLDEEGRMLPANVLRERFAALGVTPGVAVGTYCGSGVTAAHEALALAVAGVDTALYPGSWSQWSNLAVRPVETGSLGSND